MGQHSFTYHWKLIKSGYFSFFLKDTIAAPTDWTDSMRWWVGVEFIHQCQKRSVPYFNVISWWSKSEVFLHDWACKKFRTTHLKCNYRKASFKTWNAPELRAGVLLVHFCQTAHTESSMSDLNDNQSHTLSLSFQEFPPKVQSTQPPRPALQDRHVCGCPTDLAWATRSGPWPSSCLQIKPSSSSSSGVSSPAAPSTSKAPLCPPEPSPYHPGLSSKHLCF